MLTLAWSLIVNFVVSKIRKSPTSGVNAFKSLPSPEIADPKYPSANAFTFKVGKRTSQVFGKTNA